MRIYFLIPFIALFSLSAQVLAESQCSLESREHPTNISFRSLTATSKFVGFRISVDGVDEFYRSSRAIGSTTGVWTNWVGQPRSHTLSVEGSYYELDGTTVPGTWEIKGSEAGSGTFFGAYDSDFATPGWGGMRFWEFEDVSVYTRVYKRPLHRTSNSTFAQYDLGVQGGLSFTYEDQDTYVIAFENAEDRGYPDPQEGSARSTFLNSYDPVTREISGQTSEFAATFMDLCPGDYNATLRVIVATTSGSKYDSIEIPFTVPEGSRDGYVLESEIPVIPEATTTFVDLYAVDAAACGGGGRRSGDGFGNNGSIDFSIPLGNIDAVRSAGSLRLYQEAITADTFEPSALSYLAQYAAIEVKRDANGDLRQIKAPDFLIDVIDIPGPGYDLNLYSLEYLGSTYDHDTDPTTAPIYEIMPASPLYFKYEFRDLASGNTSLSILKTEANGKTEEFIYSESTVGDLTTWTLIEGDGLRIEDKTYDYSTPGLEVITTEISGEYDGSFIDTFKTVETWELQTISGVGLRRLISRVADPDGDAFTETFVYETDPNASSFGRTLYMTNRDGSWQRSEYNADGRLAREVRSVGNNSAPGFSTPIDNYRNANRESVYSYTTISDLDGDLIDEDLETETEYYLGEPIRRTFEIRYSAEVVEGASHYQLVSDIEGNTPSSSWDAPENLTTRYAIHTNGPFEGRTRWRSFPNGTASVEVHSFSDLGGDRTTRMTGVMSADIYSDNPLVLGRYTVDDRNREGFQIGMQIFERRSNGDFVIDGFSVNTADPFALDLYGRPLRLDYIDGTVEIRTYACCGLQSVLDRTGMLTEYTYDALGRVETTTTASGTTTQQVDEVVLDASGQVREQWIGKDQASLAEVFRRVYDLSGRVISEQMRFLDSAPSSARQRNYSYIQDASGFWIDTVTDPNNSTSISKRYIDGRAYENVGTATRHMRYAYGVEFDTSLGYYVQTSTTTYLDADGNLTGEYTKTFTDALGRTYKTESPAADGTVATTTQTYNPLNQLVSGADADGVTTLYAYDSLGELEVSAIDVNGDGLITYAGVGADRITRTQRSYTSKTEGANTYAVERQTVEIWEDATDTPRIVSINERTLGQLPGASLPGSITWSTEYDVTTRSEMRIDASSRTQTQTTTNADNSYAVSITIDGLLQSQTYYKDDGEVLSQQTYLYDQDNENRMTSAVDLFNGTTDYTYYLDGQLKSVTSPDPDTSRSGLGYDRQTTSYTYVDSSSEISRTITLPDLSTRTETYAPTGDLLAVSGSQTYPVSYTYDYAGRMQTQSTWRDATQVAQATLTAWEYYPNGQLRKKWYDASIDTNGVISGDSGEAYTYTASGRLATKTNARGAVATYAYAAFTADLQSIIYTADQNLTADITYADYDRLGRPQVITDGSGTRTLSYEDGQLQDELYTAGLFDNMQINRGLDSLNRPSTLELIDDVSGAATSLHRTQYGYDGASRLENVDNGDRNFNYAYDPSSALRQIITASQADTAYLVTEHYRDNLGRLASMRALDGASSALREYAYAYNALNQRIRKTEIDGTYWDYAYDSLGQLEDAQRKDATDLGLAGYDFGYRFDDIGNRLNTTVNGRTATYTSDALNQYAQRDVPRFVDVRGSALASSTVTVNGEATTRDGVFFHRGLDLTTEGDGAQTVDVRVTASLPDGGVNNAPRIADADKAYFLPTTPEITDYDADGNLITDGRWTYTWDAENRLVSVEASPAAYGAGQPRIKLDFTYDALSRRTEKKVSTWNVSTSAYELTTHTAYLYDAWNLIAELIVEGASFNVQLSSFYVWGSDLSGSMQGAGGVGGLLAVVSKGLTYAPAYDGNGNIMGYFDTSSANVAEFDYGPFGENMRATGPEAENFRFRFSTKYQDAETDLYDYGFRYYNSDTGRWLSRDPIGEEGGLNLYGMVNNDPVNYVDVVGLLPLGLNFFTDPVTTLLFPDSAYAGGTSRFVSHYFYGGGRTVNINDWLLTDDYQAARDVPNKIEWMKDRLRRKLESSMGMNTQTITGSEREAVSVTDTIFSMGNGFLTMKYECLFNCKRGGELRFICDLEFIVSDRFQDPLSEGYELWGGTPYDITGGWTERYVEL